MTREEAVSQLREMQDGDDPEAEHGAADFVLCSLLRALGYHDVVDEWDKVKKWYA